MYMLTLLHGSIVCCTVLIGHRELVSDLCTLFALLGGICAAAAAHGVRHALCKPTLFSQMAARASHQCNCACCVCWCSLEFVPCSVASDACSMHAVMRVRGRLHLMAQLSAELPRTAEASMPCTCVHMVMALASET
jgi:hypothetical protein